MRSLCVGLSVLALASVSQGRIVVYSQPVDPNGNGFFSDAVPGQFYDQLIGDGFALTGATPVSGVTFWGFSEFFDLGDYTNISSFTVVLYANNAGLPGAPIVSETFATGSTNPTAIGLAPNGAILYRQEITFSGVQNLSAGSYFVSIGATISDPFGDAWAWQSSLSGFGDSIVAQLPVGAPWGAFSGFGDMAFEINAVPTPGAASLVLVAGLTGLRRRR